MLTRLDKVENLEHSHNLWPVTFSNPMSALLDTHAQLHLNSTILYCYFLRPVESKFILVRPVTSHSNKNRIHSV